MSRVKGGAASHARHRKIIKQAAGYYGARSTNYRTAKQAVDKALQYATRDRKVRKRSSAPSGSSASTPRCASTTPASPTPA